MFQAYVLIIRRSELHYTASGIITPIGGRLVHRLREVWNKLIVKQKFCASSWLITEINILRCTVSKTSKFVIYYFECRLYHINMEFKEQVGGWLVCLISVLVMPYCFACGWPHLSINKSQVPYFTRFTKLSDQPQVFQWKKYADVVYIHLEEATFSVIPTHTQAFYIVWCKNETSTIAFNLLG